MIKKVYVRFESLRYCVWYLRTSVNSAIHCNVIMKNLQRKPKMDGGTRKNSSNQEFFILTLYSVGHCVEMLSIRAICLLKAILLLILHF